MSYFDLQVNGYFGIDFNADTLGLAEVRAACDQLKIDQVDGILATVITDDLNRMKNRLRNIVKIRESDPVIAQTIAGIHIEGPFISTEAGFVGAHPSQYVLSANTEQMKSLLDAADGLTRLVTLAPEADEQNRVTEFLIEKNVAVSAGHCNPSFETLKSSIGAGLSAVTHLGNACPAELPRHDNIIQRVLSLSDHLAIGFIADGIHVPYFALRSYLQVVGLERAFVVTDAISAAGKGPGKFQLGSQSVVVDKNLATWNDKQTNLVGSAMTMPQAVFNLKNDLGLGESDINRLVNLNPRRVVGLDN